MNNTILMLIPFLIQVESGGDPNALGDGGRALGILQIHAAAWKDGCAEMKVDWSYDTATNALRSRAVCHAYLMRYGRAYERETGRQATPEVLARIWNGGPRGWKRKGTEAYWQRVKAEMN
jgi:hypothetical protein